MPSKRELEDQIAALREALAEVYDRVAEVLGLEENPDDEAD